MIFSEYIKKAPRGTLKQIELEARVGYTTLMRAARGETISRYETARKISEATNGLVSIEELCSPPKRKVRK